MKKLLLTLSLLFYISINAQEYIPMLEDDHSWNILFVSSFGGKENGGTAPFEITGNTMINGLEYKTIIRNGNPTTCYLREQNGIIYALNEDMTDEYVYFDFTLQPGDIFDLTEYNNNYNCFDPFSFYDEITVQSIETVNIAGADRKLITFNESGETGLITWIEGIGSLSGIFPVTAIWDFSVELTCFTENEETYFFNNNNECSFLGVDNYLLNQITLTPNPVSETSTLTIPSEILETEVKFYDSTGRLIQSIKNIENTTEINKANFTTGLYFYQIFSENQLIKTERFIVR